MDYQLHLGDCLEVMAGMEAGSVDAVITDPPYGTIRAKWDSVIPFEPMWAEIERITKPNAAIVFFAAQPFTSALVMSNAKRFKYDLTWDKRRKTNHLNAKKQPLRRTENIVVFCKGQPKYNPQMVDGKTHQRGPFGVQKTPTSVYGKFSDVNRSYQSDQYYPDNLITFLSEMTPVHPTQKPVDLLEYLIRTYTDPGETVLDFTMGSGTTGVACMNTGRRFIGIELDADYFEIARRRIEIAAMQPRLIEAEG